MSGLRRFAVLGAIAALALVSAACGGDDSNAAPAPNGGPAVGQAPGDLTCPPPNIATIDPTVLKVDAAPVGSLVSGKPATFKITITNVSEGPVPLVFGSSQQADVLLSQGTTQVYDWQASRAFTQVLRCQTLNAGEAFTIQLAETNPLTVPPGDYTLTARTVTAPYPPDFTTPVTVS
jgi:hypothetical protein